MNFFDCTLIDKAGVRTLDAGYFTLQPTSDIMGLLKGLEDGVRFKLGVRPEDIEILSEASNHTCEAEVHLLEPLGDSVIVNLLIGDVSVKVKAKPGFRAGLGERVYLIFNWGRAHLFLADTEAAIY